MKTTESILHLNLPRDRNPCAEVAMFSPRSGLACSVATDALLQVTASPGLFHATSWCMALSLRTVSASAGYSSTVSR